MAITLDGTTGISSVDGSAASPSVRGSDSNSGILYSADAIKFSTGGTQRAIIDNNGLSSAGHIIQVVQTYKTDTFSAALDQAVESGDITGLTASITPASSSNKILVMFDVATGNSASSRLGITLYKAGSTLTASTGDASGSTTRFTAYGSTTADDRHWGISGKYLDTAGGTSSITYSLRMRHGNGSSNTVYVNRPGNMYNENYGMKAASNITLMEVAV